MRLRSRPVEGAANEALIGLLARATGVARSRIELVSGHRSRRKVARIYTTEPEAVAARLREAAS